MGAGFDVEAMQGLRRAFLAITNFRDEPLVKTEKGNYVITPSNPLDFKDKVKELANSL